MITLNMPHNLKVSQSSHVCNWCTYTKMNMHGYIGSLLIAIEMKATDFVVSLMMLWNIQRISLNQQIFGRSITKRNHITLQKSHSSKFKRLWCWAQWWWQLGSYKNRTANNGIAFVPNLMKIQLFRGHTKLINMERNVKNVFGAAGNRSQSIYRLIYFPG
jgi:hypothetical protein